MADVAQGTTVTWSGIALGELVGVSVDGIKADLVQITPRTQTTRDKAFYSADVDYGTVSVTCRGTAAMTSANVGLTGQLLIGSPNVSWSFVRATMESLGWSATVGELQLYSVTFKIGA